MAAHKGAKIINDTSEHVINASGVMLSSDAIVAKLTIGSSTTDVKADYITTPASAVGDYWLLTGEGGQLIRSIQLSAGSANYAL